MTHAQASDVITGHIIAMGHLASVMIRNNEYINQPKVLEPRVCDGMDAQETGRMWVNPSLS